MARRLLPHPDAFGEIYDQAAPPHVKVTDACGPDVVMMLLHALFGQPLDQPTLEAIRQWLLDHHEFTVKDGTTLEALQDYCSKVANVAASIVSSGFRDLLRQHAGIDGVGLFVTQAHNLPGNEQGVFKHFVAVLGYDDSSESYLIGNPDDVKALGGHRGPIPARWLTWSQIASGSPAGALVIGGGMGIPTGWSDSAGGAADNAGGVLTAPNGVPVDHNFRVFVLTHPWSPQNTPIAAAIYRTPYSDVAGVTAMGRRQDFQFVSLATKKNADGSYTSAFQIPTGQELVTYRAQIAALTQQVADLTAHGLPNVGSLKTSATDALASVAKIQQDLQGIISSLGE